MLKLYYFPEGTMINMLIKISYFMLLISTFVQISKETLANFNISNWRFFHIQILNHESFYRMLLNIPDFQSYYRTNVQRKKYRRLNFIITYIHTMHFRDEILWRHRFRTKSHMSHSCSTAMHAICRACQVSSENLCGLIE